MDIVPDRAELINQGKSPFADKEIEEYLAEKPLDLVATTDGKSAYRDAEFIIVATPTNYDVERNYFDTSSIDAVLELVEKVNSSATVVNGSGRLSFLRDVAVSDSKYSFFPGVLA